MGNYRKSSKKKWFKKSPKNLIFPILSRFYPDFDPIFRKFRHIFKFYNFEPHIVEIYLTTQIKAIPVEFMHKLSLLLQRMPIFLNPPPKLAQKRDNRGNQKKQEKLRISEIHAYMAILWLFYFFGLFTKEIIPEITKNRSTYPHVINNK